MHRYANQMLSNFRITFEWILVLLYRSEKVNIFVGENETVAESTRNVYDFLAFLPFKEHFC